VVDAAVDQLFRQHDQVSLKSAAEPDASTDYAAVSDNSAGIIAASMSLRRQKSR
jgi:hypothetical protein